MLAMTTHAMASHWIRVRNSPSTIIAASAAAAGSRLIKMLKTRGGMRRNAMSSKLYGMTEDAEHLSLRLIQRLGHHTHLISMTHRTGHPNATRSHRGVVDSRTVA